MAAVPAFIPNLAPSINPNPQPIVKLGHSMFSDVGSLDKVFKCFKSAIDWLSATAPSLPACLPILGSLVKGAGEVMTPFQFFKVAKEWTEINKKTRAGKASLVGITAVTAIGLGRFLEKIQLFNMTAAVSKLGNVPVLGHIVNVPFGVLTAGVSAFSALDAGIKLRKVIRPHGTADKANAKLRKWEARQQAVARFNKEQFSELSSKQEFEAIPNWNQSGTETSYSDKIDRANQAVSDAFTNARTEALEKDAGDPGTVEAAANTIKANLSEARVKLITEKTVQLLSSHPNPTAENAHPMDAVHAYTAYKVRHWRTEALNAQTESKKAYFTLASEISKFALIVLGLVGASFSIAALAVSSIPMLTFGLIVASIALAKQVYDTKHKNNYEMAPSDNFEAAVVEKYSTLKAIEKEKRKAAGAIF